MEKPRTTPPRKLFALLDFLRLPYKDLAAHLHVSEALISMWRKGVRTISSAQYYGMMSFVVALLETHLRAFLREQATLSAAARHTRLAYFTTFLRKIREANLERDPLPLSDHLADALTRLQHTGPGHGPVSTWDDATLAAVAADAKTILDVVAAIQARRHAMRDLPLFQDEVTSLEELLVRLIPPPQTPKKE